MSPGPLIIMLPVCLEYFELPMEGNLNVGVLEKIGIKWRVEEGMDFEVSDRDSLIGVFFNVSRPLLIMFVWRC